MIGWSTTYVPGDRLYSLPQLAGQEEYGIQSMEQRERAWDQASNMNGKPKQSHVLVTDSHHPLHTQYDPLLLLASNFNPIIQVLSFCGSVLMVGCGTLEQSIGTHHPSTHKAGADGHLPKP